MTCSDVKRPHLRPVSAQQRLCTLFCCASHARFATYLLRRAGGIPPAAQTRGDQSQQCDLKGKRLEEPQCETAATGPRRRAALTKNPTC